MYTLLLYSYPHTQGYTTLARNQGEDVYLLFMMHIEETKKHTCMTLKYNYIQ